MLKVTAPYVRETPVMDEGKPIVIKVDPPGLVIGFRLRHSKQTYYLRVMDAYKAARYTANPEIKTERPKAVKVPSIRDEIVRVLTSGKRLNIARIMQRLREKDMAIDRRMAGEILELMKETGKVKQEGFDYELTNEGH